MLKKLVLTFFYAPGPAPVRVMLNQAFVRLICGRDRFTSGV